MVISSPILVHVFVMSPISWIVKKKTKMLRSSGEVMAPAIVVVPSSCRLNFNVKTLLNASLVWQTRLVMVSGSG